MRRADRLFQLPPLWVAVATVQAAMPIGANVFVLAEHYGCRARAMSAAGVSFM